MNNLKDGTLLGQILIPHTENLSDYKNIFDW